MNLQNFNKNLLSEELVKEIESSSDLNLRSSEIETLSLNSNYLKWIDLKKTKSLKEIRLNCPRLETIHLTGTGAERIEIFSDRLLDLSIQGAKNLKKLELKTKNLEHLDLEIEKIDSALLNQIEKLENLKGINNVYNNEKLPIRDFIHSFEKVRTKQIEKHKKDCGCSSCKSGNKEYIEGLRFKLNI